MTDGNPTTQIVYLEGSFELIWGRMQARENHYMRPDMLRSQFDTLEPPQDVLIVSIENSVDEIVASIVKSIIV